MKRPRKGKRDPDMLDEYDFSKGVRGKYASKGGTAMTITIEPALEAALRERAQAQGISPEEFAIKTLRERLLSRPQPIEPRDDWERRLLAMGSDCGVVLSNEALSSEGLYE
jgi:hypothetical protein